MSDIELPADKCGHNDFFVKADVHRILDDHDQSKVIAFSVDIHVTCQECGTPFEWIGLPAGLLPAQPTVGVDGLELRAPIRPQGSTMMRPGPGFTIQPGIRPPAGVKS